MQQQIPNNSGVVKDEISLKELILSVQTWWKYMLSKWKVIVLFGLIGGVLGLTYSLLKSPTYKAQAMFVLEDAESSGGYASIAAKFGLSVGGSDAGLFSDDDNIIVFLKSRTINARTLLSPIEKKENSDLLIDKYIQFNKLKEKWKSDRLRNVVFKPNPEDNNLLADSLITAIYKTILEENLEVFKPDKDGNIISVVTTSKDELFSKYYTEMLIKEATDFYMSTMTKKSIENVEILQNQADSIKTLLNYAIVGVAVNTDAVPNLNPAYQRLKVPSQKKVVDVEMNKAILEELVKNLEIAKINLRRESPLFQMIDKPVLPLEKKRVGKFKGILLGGISLGFLTLLFLSVKLLVVKLLKQEG